MPKVGRTAYVGASSRTDDAGIAQLRTLIEPRGWTVVPVPVRRVLHLKSAVTALPDGTVIGFPASIEPDHSVPTFLPVPEEPGTAVVDLGGGAVLTSAAAPLTRQLLEARGLRVVPIPIGEFEKLEGCVTCLSVRLRWTRTVGEEGRSSVTLPGARSPGPWPAYAPSRSGS